MRCRFFFLAHFAAIHHDTTGSFSTSGVERPWAFLLGLRGVFVWRSKGSSSRTQHFGSGDTPLLDRCLLRFVAGEESKGRVGKKT